MQTHFAREARRLPVTQRQYEIIVGSLLGDGTLLATTRGYCFRVHQGLRQRSLTDWKYRELRTFVRTPPRVSGAGYYFRTISHDAFRELRAQFYRGARKVVPFDVLHQELTALMLAVWIMDDGSADGTALRINTQNFTWSECESLVQLLQSKIGLEFTSNADKGMPRLRCRAGWMHRLIDMVRPHIIPEMQYKLPDAGATANAGSALIE